MIGLSKSALEVFQSCPKCFWMDKMSKVGRPRGPMPSVVNAIDAQMKALVEGCVSAGTPVPYLAGCDQLPYPDRQKVGTFRSWRTFQAMVEAGDRTIKAWGELDDLLVEGDGSVSPWDYKSKGTAPTQEYCEKYNQNQGDMYHLLLEGQGLKCSGRAMFTYIWPEFVSRGGLIQFQYMNIVMETDPARAKKILNAAAECLEGPCPKEGELSCNYCNFIIKRRGH
jgi:PD-(D/E)XK nuclease superfamily